MALRDDRALPAGVRGPVERVQGLTRRISADWRLRSSSVQVRAMGASLSFLKGRVA
jgi:hypothetical protein